IARKPLEHRPQVAALRRFGRLQARRPQRDAPAFADAVPRLRSRDPRDLVGHVARGRSWIEEQTEGLRARGLVLADDELAVAGARAPVDAAQLLPRAVLADAEELGARACSRCHQAGLELARRATACKRPEAREHERDLDVRASPRATEKAQRVAAADPPAGRANRASPDTP